MAWATLFLRTRVTKPQQRLAALYDTYHVRVYRFCLRLCDGHPEEAEDLAQEVFLAALGSLPRFAGRSTVQTWLFRIAVFRSRDLRRRQPSLSLSALDHAVAGHEEQALSLLALQSALAALPEPLREAFVLVKCEQLTHKEAARVLELPQGTVQSRVFDAVRLLRVQLTELEEYPIAKR